MNDKDENPYDYPLEADSKPPRKGWRLLEVMVVLVILLVLVGLLIPTSRRAGPQVVNRMVCHNKLQQLSIALLNYNAEYKALPPAYTTDAEGKPLHSWRVLILPYVEQNTLYQKIDLSKPWDDDANAEARANMPAVFRCPGVRMAPGHTTYLALVGEHHGLMATSSRKMEQVTDGPEGTILLYEVNASQSVHWMSPNDANQEMFLSQTSKKDGPHSLVRNISFMDGSVLAITNDLSLEMLKALSTIDGKENVDWE